MTLSSSSTNRRHSTPAKHQSGVLLVSLRTTAKQKEVRVRVFCAVSSRKHAASALLLLASACSSTLAALDLLLPGSKQLQKLSLQWGETSGSFCPCRHASSAHGHLPLHTTLNPNLSARGFWQVLAASCQGTSQALTVFAVEQLGVQIAGT